MENIEVLSVFFKLFRAFGLQFFPLSKLQEKQSRRSVWNTLYFFVLVVIFSSLVTCFVLIGIENEEKIVKAKNFFNLLIKLTTDLGLILAIIVALTESYQKTEKMKKVLRKSKEIFMFCQLEFDHIIDYKKFKRKWLMTVAVWSLVFTIINLALTIESFLTGKRKTPLAILISLTLFLWIVIFKFVFFVDLVNFQMENLHKVIQQKLFLERDKKSSKVIEARRLFQLIVEMGQLTNKISSVCVAIVTLIITTIMINTGYELLVTADQGFRSKNLIRK